MTGCRFDTLNWSIESDRYRYSSASQSSLFERTIIEQQNKTVQRSQHSNCALLTVMGSSAPPFTPLSQKLAGGQSVFQLQPRRVSIKESAPKVVFLSSNDLRERSCSDSNREGSPYNRKKLFIPQLHDEDDDDDDDSSTIQAVSRKITMRPRTLDSSQMLVLGLKKNGVLKSRFSLSPITCFCFLMMSNGFLVIP